MPTVRECPGCGRRLQLPASLTAACVQCPGCQLTFSCDEVPVPGPAEALSNHELNQADAMPGIGPSGQLALDEPTAEPFVRQSLPRQPSPMRAVLVNEGLVPPRELEEERMAKGDAASWQHPRRDCEPHRASLLFFLSSFGVIAAILPVGFAIGLPVCAITWVLARRDIDMMLQGEMDPSGLATNQAARRNAILGTVFGSLWLAAAVCGFVLVATRVP